ncbi:MAG: DUF1538 domain-containing protein [Oscillospiraceae bacterium]|nr:DUF1538 domain-containing protein [Oscillospiraceae bacterium]
MRKRSGLNKNLKLKINEALSSVLPITAIVLVLSVTLAPVPVGIMSLFVVGAMMLILGMGLFSLGVDVALTPMGEALGVTMTKSRRIYLLLFVSLVVGILITAAEPDLAVLASQLSAVPGNILIATISVGVGIFLVISMLRILLKVPLRLMLMGLYIIVFGLAAISPDNFIPVAFDSGGVTTGPITVPFILALGVGVASVRSDKDSHDDSFGLVALCSVGPVLSVMILGMLYKPESAAASTVTFVTVEDTIEVSQRFLDQIPHYFSEVLVTILPIAAVFLIYNLFTRRFRGKQLKRIIVGFIYTYTGLGLFLTGVNVGFLPAGNYLGTLLASSEFKWLLIPLGMLIGYFIVIAEPSVHVLNHQVETITNGAVTHKAMNLSLSVGVAASAGLAMTRVLTGIDIFWFLIPGYAIAIILSFFVPRIFTGIAFDSGGVASGPMTATFLLPFAMGACKALGGNILTDAFGVVAMVAMTPLITIQALGMIYKRRVKALIAVRRIADSLPDVIIDYEDDEVA